MQDPASNIEDPEPMSAALPARRALQLGEANASFRLRYGYDVTSWRIRCKAAADKLRAEKH